MDDETRRALRLLRAEIEVQRVDTLRVLDALIKPIQADIEDLRLMVQAQQMVLKQLGDEEQLHKAYTDQFKKAQQRWAWRLSQLMNDYFNNDELEQIAFELGIDTDNVMVGERKRNRVIDLCEYCRKRDMLNMLATACHARRPQLNWPLLAADVEDLDEPS